jgi:hypothetical protein
MSSQNETGSKTKSQKPAKRRVRSEKRPEQSETSESKAEVVDQMISDFRKKVDKGEVKVSVGDFIRLVQLRGDLDVEEPKEIRVTWVEPTETEYAKEE